MMATATIALKPVLPARKAAARGAACGRAMPVVRASLKSRPAKVRLRATRASSRPPPAAPASLRRCVALARLHRRRLRGYELRAAGSGQPLSPGSGRGLRLWTPIARPGLGAARRTGPRRSDALVRPCGAAGPSFRWCRVEGSYSPSPLRAPPAQVAAPTLAVSAAAAAIVAEALSAPAVQARGDWRAQLRARLPANAVPLASPHAPPPVIHAGRAGVRAAGRGRALHRAAGLGRAVRVRARQCAPAPHCSSRAPRLGCADPSPSRWRWWCGAAAGCVRRAACAASGACG